MDIALKLISLLVQLEPLAAAGINLLGIIQQANKVLQTAQTEGRDPTDAEWATVDAMEVSLRKRLHAP